MSAELVARGRILPVLDGLDEMDRDPAQADRAIAAISRVGAFAVGPEFGVVLSCREREWSLIARRSEGLSGTTAVHIREVDSKQAQHYITARIREGAACGEGWQSVLANLEANPNGLLMQVLNRPLWLLPDRIGLSRRPKTPA